MRISTIIMIVCLLFVTQYQTGCAEGDKEENNRTKIIVYYFHMTIRCHSCLKIEKLTYRAIKKYFNKEIKKGIIIWRTLNREYPENQKLEKLFNLIYNSVVVVEMHKGKIKRWKILKNTWDLFEKENEFMKYIKKEINSFL